MLVAHGRNRRRQIELAGILLRRRVPFEEEPRIAQRLIAGLRASTPLAGNDPGRFGILAAPQQFNDTIEIRCDVERQVAAAWLAGVECVLVELQALFGHAAEDHRAQAAGADGQRFVPVWRGLSIPEPQARRWAPAARPGTICVSYDPAP